MGGIESWHDAAEFIALGCANVQVTTAVMQYGYRIIDDLTDGLSRFLSENGYERLSDFVGTADGEFVTAEELNRSSTVYPVFDKKNCVGCGRKRKCSQDFPYVYRQTKGFLTVQKLPRLDLRRGKSYRRAAALPP